MSKFAPAVERWRSLVVASAPRFLVDFVLSIIQNESYGRPGIAAKRTTKLKRALPVKGGGQMIVKRALGLMQTIPAVIQDYNAQAEHEPAYWDDMTGTTPTAAQKQIDVGIWTLQNNISAVEKLTGKQLSQGGKLDLDLMRLALVAYAWGIGRLKKKLRELEESGKAPTFKNLAAAWPELGKPANRPLYYANKIVNRMVGKPTKPGGKPSNGGTAGNIALFALGGLLLWQLAAKL